MSESAKSWFGVRGIIHDPDREAYEERITIWHCPDAETALQLAEAEAVEYGTFAGLLQVFHMFDRPEHGAEVFSLIRDSTLPVPEYLDRFFDTGAEREQSI